MNRPVPTVKILWVLLLFSMFLNVAQILDAYRLLNRLHSYAEECGDRSDSGGHR